MSSHVFGIVGEADSTRIFVLYYIYNLRFACAVMSELYDDK